MQENEKKVIFSPKVGEEGRIDEFPTINPEELQTPNLSTLPEPTTIEQEKKIMEDVENMSPEELKALKSELQNVTNKLDADDLNKKNYVKISPTFYLQTVKNDDEDDETELFKILNPVEGTVETRELTDDEKKELLISELKRSKQKFNPLSHPTKTVGKEIIVNSIGGERQVKTKEYQTNITNNKFNTAYKQKRRRKNNMAKISRKNNR